MISLLKNKIFDYYKIPHFLLDALIQQKYLRQENIKLLKKLKINEILNTYSIEKLERDKNELRKNFEKTTKELENKNKILEESNIDLKNKLKDSERKVKDLEDYRRKL